MNTIKRMRSGMIALAILLTIGTSSSSAQTTDEWNHIQLNLSVGVASDLIVNADISCHYMFLPFVGIGGGVGVMGQYDYNKSPFGEISTGHSTRAFWGIEESKRKIVRPYIRPSLLLRTPALLKMGANRDYRLRLQVEPGILLTIPYSRVKVDYVWYPEQGGPYPSPDDGYDLPFQTQGFSSSKGDWCFWNLKSSLTVSNDKVSFSLGYSVSNFDIYSIRRNITAEEVSFRRFYPKRDLNHCVFAAIGYAF